MRGWAESLPHSKRGEREPYRSYRDTWLQVAAHAESERARAFVAGRSHRGEPLWTVVVEPERDDHGTVFVMAGIHAMEHVGVATAVELLARAVSAESPWRERRLAVLPMGNPDGFLEVEAALARGERRFRRKNARGVDLNRNFAEAWDADYYLNRLLRGIYSPGDSPLSEPETRAIDSALSELSPRFAVSLHAFGQWIYLPYAGTREAPPDLPAMKRIAHKMTECQPTRPYKVVQLGTRSRLFRACGTEIDHFYARHGALSFLIEIGAGPRFREPITWLDPYSWFTPPAYLLERDVANVVPAIECLASASTGA